MFIQWGRLPVFALVLTLPLGGLLTAQHVPDRSQVTLDVPDGACNRSNKDWPSQPIRIAVLDFGYPGQSGSSRSGVVLADMVYDRLAEDKSFDFSRGDWKRIEYDDFARAASMGRMLGVDAVLAGSWEFENQAGPIAGVRTGLLMKSRKREPMKMVAGLVDTCTGELIMKVTSDDCMRDGSTGAQACSREPISMSAATNPGAWLSQIDGGMDRMLYSLQHTANGRASSSGVVKTTDRSGLTVELPAGSPVKVGDQLSVKATRVGKDLANYSLHNLYNQEIGKVTVREIAGSSASGVFSGDYAPMPGDMVQSSQSH